MKGLMGRGRPEGLGGRMRAVAVAVGEGKENEDVLDASGFVGP